MDADLEMDADPELDPTLDYCSHAPAAARNLRGVPRWARPHIVGRSIHAWVHGDTLLARAAATGEIDRQGLHDHAARYGRSVYGPRTSDADRHPIFVGVPLMAVHVALRTAAAHAATTHAASLLGEFTHHWFPAPGCVQRPTHIKLALSLRRALEISGDLYDCPGLRELVTAGARTSDQEIAACIALGLRHAVVNVRPGDWEARASVLDCLLVDLAVTPSSLASSE